jgi:hypothetical protein
MSESWKRQEREVAALFGSHRNPNTGEWRADIDTPVLAVEHKKRKHLPGWFKDAVQQAVREHKKRKHLPGWFKDAVQQAVRAATETQTGIVVFSEVSQGKKAQRYVTLRLEDWLAFHG